MLGNAGTLISFRLGPEDAAFIAREFEPYLYHLDLLNLPNYQMYLKLMRDSAPLKPFSATTLPWQQAPMAFADDHPAPAADTDVRYYLDKHARALLAS